MCIYSTLVCEYIYTYVYTYKYTYTYTHTHTHTIPLLEPRSEAGRWLVVLLITIPSILVDMTTLHTSFSSASLPPCVCACVNIYMIYIYMYVYAQYIFAYMASILVDITTLHTSFSSASLRACVCVCTLMIYSYVYMCTYVMDACISICMHKNLLYMCIHDSIWVDMTT